MAYAQIHTQAVRHPKLIQLSNAGFRLWIAGLCHAQAFQTDGFLDRVCLKDLMCGIRKARSQALVHELVTLGLWDIADGGWRLHDYEDWNWTRAEILSRQHRWKQRRPVESSSSQPSSQPNYYEYIQSDEWRARATAAKQRARGRCQVCNCADQTLDAHHRTYERLGHEDPEDITVLCRRCHELYEEARRGVGTQGVG